MLPYKAPQKLAYADDINDDIPKSRQNQKKDANQAKRVSKLYHPRVCRLFYVLRHNSHKKHQRNQVGELVYDEPKADGY